MTFVLKMSRMNLDGSRLRLALLALVAAMLGAGCSGINASHSVSPATFLLPGLMQHTSPPSSPDAGPPMDDTVAIVAPAP